MFTSFVSNDKQDYIVAYQPWLDVISQLPDKRPIVSTESSSEFICPSNANSLFFIGPPTFCEPVDLISLRRRLNIPIGMVRVKTPNHVLNYFSRRFEVPTLFDIFFDRLSTGAKVILPDSAFYPEGALTNSQETLAAIQHPSRLFAITSHGRGDAVYLPHMLLCGRQSERGNIAVDEVRLPACAHDNECFYRGRSTFPLEQVQSRIIFLNSCASLSGGKGLFAEGYALDSNFASHPYATHLIGSPLIRYGEPAQVRFFSLLLNLGLPIGLCVCLVEDAIYMRSLDLPTLLLYGDPVSTFSAPNSNGVHIAKLEEETLDIPPHTSLVMIPDTPEKDEILAISNADSLTVYPTRLGFFIFARAGELPEGKYTMERIKIPQISSQIQENVFLPLQRYKNLRLFDLHPGKMKGRLVDLENRGTAILSGLASLITDQKIGKLKRAQSKAFAITEQIDADVLDAILETSSNGIYHLGETYRQECQLVSFQQEEQCAYCGKYVDGITWQHPVDASFRRRMSLCPRCGYISDQPSTRLINAAFSAESFSWKKGQQEQVVLNFEQCPVGGSILCVLVDSHRFGAKAIYEQCTINPGQRAYPFTLSIPESLPSHHFWLSAFLVHQGLISSWGTNVWLHP